MEVLDAVSVMIWPVMPGSSDKLRAQLGLPPVTPAPGKDQWPFAKPKRAPEARLGPSTPLFPRIDPDREALILAGLGVSPAATPEPPDPSGGHAKTTPSTEASAGSLRYDDFAKLDLRVGVVVRAERVRGKDKLLSLSVDIGEAEPRAIVAGLALSFRPEDLVGKRVVLVANLEPRSFGKDLVSRGMLLATGPSEALQLVTVGDQAPPGSKIK
jgi:methionyl-tRNA synthetase